MFLLSKCGGRSCDTYHHHHHAVSSTMGVGGGGVMVRWHGTVVVHVVHLHMVHPHMVHPHMVGRIQFSRQR